MEIQLKLDVTKVNPLCHICDTMPFDVNVISGRICVDGKSIMGVMEMCGRTVTLAPVTQDNTEFEMFFDKVQEIGAYKTEGFY